MALREGDIIHSRYRLLRLIGTGTSGAVWAARNELIEREVALKIMEPEVMSDKVLLRRFFNEAKAIGRVKHPSIVGILDLGQAEDGSPFLVLELLDGEPLGVRIERDGKMDPETLVDVASGVAGALELAHQQKIIHRDLKPANIILHHLPNGGQIGKILDFGISKVFGGSTNFSLTRTGTVVGSPAYMSPEQAAGQDDIDGRADVWSLGVVMYEALTGALPHEAANYNALMVRILTRDAPSIATHLPHLAPKLVALVDSCLKRNRDLRPFAGDLANQLETITKELRAERFSKSGGRRQDDGQGNEAANVTAGGLSGWRLVLLLIVWGIVAGAAGIALDYFFLRGVFPLAAP